MIHRDCPGDRILFAAQPFVGKARTAPCYTFNGRARKHSRHGACGRRIPDPHLAQREQAIALCFLFAHQVDSDIDRSHGLHFRHCGFQGNVAGSAPDVPAEHRFRHRPRNAHIHRDHVRPCDARHAADAGIPLCGVFRHDGRHILPCLRHALRDNAVIRAHHQDSPLSEHNIRTACDACDPYHRILQKAEAVQRLCNRVPPPAGHFHRGSIKRQDLPFYFIKRHCAFLLCPAAHTVPHVYLHNSTLFC